MSITRDEVAHLARLARIALSDAELDHLAPQLDQIITAVAQVQEVAADGIPPTSHATGLTNVFRDDEPAGCLTAAASARPGTRGRAAAFQGAADPGGGVMAELTRLTAAELSAALATGEVSATEVTRAHLDRIAAVDDRVHAFLHVAAQSALAQAARIDARRAAGEPLGPLAGVPVAVKDVFTTVGMPTTCGSRILEGWHPPYDATITTGG